MPRGPDASASTAEVRGKLDAEPRLSWLLRQKVTIPGRAPGYMHRTRLVDRAMPTRNRLTVLLAPGGFGKTTLLAECCRHLSQDGIVTAWMSIDGNEDADVLDSYIAFAFQYAGMRIESASGGADSESRVGLLARALEARREPFVLALDDLHRLTDRRSIALVEFLLRRGPPNLHLAAACRRLPAGLNVGGAVLDGVASVLGVDDLRFTRHEIADFFDRRLSRRGLASLTEDSGGWPMALRIHRNRAGADPGTGGPEVRDIVENWVESRLWEGIDAGDRELLLDAGLLEWMDAELLDDVLGGNDAMRRIEAMAALVGLLHPVRGNGPETWRLHPLIREHCARARYRDTRQRFREVHRRIAGALMRRGETLLAMRHASQAGDIALAGEIFENAGAVRFWIRHGEAPFRAAMGLLDRQVLLARPRLRLAHCVALVFSGRLEEARETWRSMAEGSRGPAATEGEAHERWVDGCIVRGVLAMYGGEFVGSARAAAVLEDLRKIAGSQDVDPLVRGYAEHGLCIALNARAEFAGAEMRAERALACFGDSRYARMLVAYQLGQVAMAQGRVDDARRRYLSAMRIAKAEDLHNPLAVAIADVLLQELEQERNRRPPSPEPPGIPAALTRNGTPFQAYAAASGVALDRALADTGAEGALAALEEMLDYVRSVGLPALARYLSAMRVSLLVEACRPGEAQRCWREDGLPEDAPACLDLEGQTWREMEALSCARLRLAIARGRFDEARGFAAGLRSATADRGLRRTLMRALTLSVVLERRAGDAGAAGRHLAEFLALFAETDYARPAVRERRACAPAVERFLDEAGDSPLREPARALLAAMRDADSGTDPALRLSGREREILHRLEGQRDKVIAAELGLTPHGVRYHIRGLFAKLEVRSRGDAVRRARELGLLPDGD